MILVLSIIGLVTTVLDPNWFYSSLAQSAAAIVGLLGGITAGRLQSEITAAREQKLKVVPHLIPLYSVLAQIRDPMREYLEHADEQIYKLLEGMAAGVEKFERQLWYAPFEKSQAVPAPASMVEAEKDRKRDTSVLLPLVEAALSANSVVGIYELERRITTLISQLSGHTRHYGTQIHNSGLQAARELRVLGLRSRTTAHWFLWSCLVTLTGLGVVLPLGFLSAHSARHKFVLIGAFAAALAVLLGYLAWQVRELGRIAQWHSLLPPDDPELSQ